MPCQTSISKVVVWKPARTCVRARLIVVMSPGESGLSAKFPAPLTHDLPSFASPRASCLIKPWPELKLHAHTKSPHLSLYPTQLHRSTRPGLRCRFFFAVSRRSGAPFTLGKNLHLSPDAHHDPTLAFTWVSVAWRGSTPVFRKVSSSLTCERANRSFSQLRAQTHLSRSSWSKSAQAIKIGVRGPAGPSTSGRDSARPTLEDSPCFAHGR